MAFSRVSHSSGMAADDACCNSSFVHSLMFILKIFYCITCIYWRNLAIGYKFNFNKPSIIKIIITWYVKELFSYFKLHNTLPENTECRGSLSVIQWRIWALSRRSHYCYYKHVKPISLVSWFFSDAENSALTCLRYPNTPEILHERIQVVFSKLAKGKYFSPSFSSLH